jgi:hypothetical protein
MKNNQLTKGQKRRVMYIENKDGDIDGAAARIGWVTFSKTGLSVYYRGRTLQRASGGVWPVIILMLKTEMNIGFLVSKNAVRINTVQKQE